MDLANAPSLALERASCAPQARARVVVLDAAALADPALRARWERLAREASEPNPFFEPWLLLSGIER